MVGKPQKRNEAFSEGGSPLTPAWLWANTSGWRWFWGLSSALVALVCGGWVLAQGWGTDVVQDDARQHVFWMGRFQEPGLFPGDYIADYFESVAPWGYTQLYRLGAGVGLEPLLLSKLLPPLVGLGATLYGFGVAQELLGLPFAGFLSAVLLNQMLWGYDDVASASPRAFMPVLLMAFLYYFLRCTSGGDRRRVLLSALGCLGCLGLEGLFYPQYVLVMAGVWGLGPLCWEGRRVWLDWGWGLGGWARRLGGVLGVGGLVLALGVMGIYALRENPFGPVILASEAQQSPVFHPGGRGAFFGVNPWQFWVGGDRSGFLPNLKPPLLALGAAFPWLWRYRQEGSRYCFVLRRWRDGNQILSKLLLVGFGLFGLAHGLLFRLHLPSRYTGYTLRYTLLFATVAVLMTLIEQVCPPHLPQEGWRRERWRWVGLLGLVVVMASQPNPGKSFPSPDYIVGRSPQLYAFLRQQPLDTQIASLASEASNLPSLTHRSVLVAREYAIPYHQGYAQQFDQRAQDILLAEYTQDSGVLRGVIERYGVDFWLWKSGEAFGDRLLERGWLRQYPEAIAAARQSLNRGPSLLQGLGPSCTVLQEGDLVLVDASCVQRQLR